MRVRRNNMKSVLMIGQSKGEKMYLDMMEFALGKMTYEKFVERLGSLK